MKKEILFLILLCITMSANEEKLILGDKQENSTGYFDEEQVSSLKAKKNDSLGKYENKFSTDISNYKKVALMDVVLETVSNSDLLKAARESVIQSEIKLEDVMAGYYPVLNLEVESGRTRNTNLDSTTKDIRAFKYYNDRTYKFILNQNIYAGGETSNSIKSLEKKLSVEKNQYQIVLQEQITKAIKAYFDVVFSYRSVLVSESNMKNLNKILEIVTIKYDTGAASIGDITAIKANVSNAQTQLTKVRSKLTESIRYYEYIVGEKYIETLPYEKNFNINVSTFDLLYERGIKNNSTILNYYQSIDAEKYTLKSKKSAFAPKLDFEVSLDTVLAKEDYEEKEHALNALFRLTFNLYNGGRDENKVLNSFSMIRELNFKLEEEKKKLRWNISKLFTSIESTNESLKSNISEVISLRKMVDAYWEEFNLGQQDLQTLLQGHKQLNSAEIELIKYESNNITDFFTLLGYTGDLLSFFDMDPENPKFIDFSNANYSENVYIDDKFLTEKEKIERENENKKELTLKNSLANKALKDENINEFIKKFLISDDDFYTIEISTFNEQKEAIDFIKSKEIDKNSFSYELIDNLKVNSKVAHGIFQNIEAANKEIDKLRKNNIEKSLVIKKVKDDKKLYSDYSNGLKVELPPQKVKIIERVNTIEKIKQEKKEDKFKFNQEIKNDFLNSDPENFTINVSSFNNIKELEKILIENPNLYEKSFTYNYFNGTKLAKWNYGIYKTYDDAQKAIASLEKIVNSYYPIVIKVSKEQMIYKLNLEAEDTKPKKEPEYEYINESSKIEYKEPKSNQIKENFLLLDKVQK